MPEAFLVPITIALGAVPGALSRFYITEWTKRLWGIRFPYGTYLINLTGCWMMGFFVTIIPTDFSPEIRLLVATGFLGSYTTFSTYSYDTLTLWRSGNIGSTVFYWVGSILFGALAMQLGITLAKSFL